MQHQSDQEVAISGLAIDEFRRRNRSRLPSILHRNGEEPHGRGERDYRENRHLGGTYTRLLQGYPRYNEPTIPCYREFLWTEKSRSWLIKRISRLTKSGFLSYNEITVS